MEIIVKKGRKTIPIKGGYYWDVAENALFNLVLAVGALAFSFFILAEKAFAFFLVAALVSIVVILIYAVRWWEMHTLAVKQMIFDLDKQILTWGEKRVDLTKAKIIYAPVLYYVGKHGVDFEYAKVQVSSGKERIVFKINLAKFINLKDAVGLPMKEEKQNLEVWE